jgi:hypothetical protein
MRNRHESEGDTVRSNTVNGSIRSSSLNPGPMNAGQVDHELRYSLVGGKMRLGYDNNIRVWKELVWRTNVINTTSNRSDAIMRGREFMGQRQLAMYFDGIETIGCCRSIRVSVGLLRISLYLSRNRMTHHRA